MTMRYSQYLNDGGQFAIDNCEGKVSQEKPARPLQVAGPTSWAFCNALNGAVYFGSKFFSGGATAFKVPIDSSFVFGCCVFVKLNSFTCHDRAW